MTAVRQQLAATQLADGTEIAYAVAGSGPLLVHAPGWLTHLELSWAMPPERGFYEALARGRTLVRYDRPGCGLSGPTTETPSMDLEIRDPRGSGRCSDLVDGHDRGRAVRSLARSGRGGLLRSDVSRVGVAVGLVRRVGARSRRRLGREPRTRPRPDQPAVGPRLRRTRRHLRSQRRREDPSGVHRLPACGHEPADRARPALRWPTTSTSPTTSPGSRRRHWWSTATATGPRPWSRAARWRRGIPGASLEVLDGRDHLPYIGDAAGLATSIRRFLGLPAARAGSATALTDRQQQVARLVTEGMTNREIAAELTITERSVESHVERIRDRLGFRSRSQVAAWYTAGGR